MENAPRHEESGIGDGIGSYSNVTLLDILNRLRHVSSCLRLNTKEHTILTVSLIFSLVITTANRLRQKALTVILPSNSIILTP